MVAVMVVHIAVVDTAAAGQDRHNSVVGPAAGIVVGAGVVAVNRAVDTGCSAEDTEIVVEASAANPAMAGFGMVAAGKRLT